MHFDVLLRLTTLHQESRVSVPVLHQQCVFQLLLPLATLKHVVFAPSDSLSSLARLLSAASQLLFLRVSVLQQYSNCCASLPKPGLFITKKLLPSPWKSEILKLPSM
jgi:hypothetical protein